MTDSVQFTIQDLLNYHRLRTICKELSLDQVSTLIDKLTNIQLEREKAEQAEKEAIAQKEQALKEILDLAKEKGLTLGDVSNLGIDTSLIKPRKGKAKFDPKYAWTNEDGSKGYWSGQGMIPRALRIVMEKDGIDDKQYYLINSE